MEKLLESKSNLLYVFRNKETGEYIDENYDPTEDIYEAIGYEDMSLALAEIAELDEPDKWYLVKKVITITAVGEPIKITEFI